MAETEAKNGFIENAIPYSPLNHSACGHFYSFDPIIAAQLVLESLPSRQKLDVVYTAFIGALLTDPFIAVYKRGAKHNGYVLFNIFLDTLREGLKARVLSQEENAEQQYERQVHIDQIIEAIRIDLESQ